MKRFFLYSLVTAVFALFTILFALYVSLRSIISNDTTLALKPSSNIYTILIIFVVITIVLSILQLYIARQAKRSSIFDTEELEIKLPPEILLKEQIKNEVKRVVEEVEQTRCSLSNQTELEIPKDVLAEINEILHISSNSAPAALLLLSAKIEQQVRLRLQEIGLQSDTNYLSPHQIIDLAVKANLFPAITAPTFRDFLDVRNKIAHSAAFDVDESTILALISIGIELLKIISTKKHSDVASSISHVEKEA